LCRDELSSPQYVCCICTFETIFPDAQQNANWHDIVPVLNSFLFVSPDT
jgi:hypothetical protein